MSRTPPSRCVNMHHRWTAFILAAISFVALGAAAFPIKASIDARGLLSGHPTALVTPSDLITDWSTSVPADMAYKALVRFSESRAYRLNSIQEAP